MRKGVSAITTMGAYQHCCDITIITSDIPPMMNIVCFLIGLAHSLLNLPGERKRRDSGFSESLEEGRGAVKVSSGPSRTTVQSQSVTTVSANSSVV